jgi:hypothetical protein
MVVGVGEAAAEASEEEVAGEARVSHQCHRRRYRRPIRSLSTSLVSSLGGHPWHWTLSDRNHTRPQAYYSKHLPLRRSSLDRGMVLIVEIKGRIAQEGSSADMCDGG